MKTERRYQPAGDALEIRQDQNGNISGYAAVFYNSEDRGTAFGLWDGAEERILPGAFSRAISEKDDARALFNHEADKLLGRVSAGTLQLSEDARGLHYSISLGNTTAAKDVREMINRGDLTGSSFSFKVTDEDWSEEDGKQVRNIKGVELFDVGPVTFPAYEASTANSRDIEGAKESLEEAEREKVKERVNERFDALALKIDPELADSKLSEDS